MDLSLFDYKFPRELVAQRPLPRRDDSRMMVLHREKGDWDHRRFPDLLRYLRPGDLLVLNDAEADLVPWDGKLVPHLPPYIKRKRASDFTEEDYQRYRTVYAKAPGSKAAPTAGFHFTEETLRKIEDHGIEIRFLTLHISHDTYKPIRTPQIEDHPMHGEGYFIPDETAEAVIRAKKEGRRVIAAGTTVVRVLESWAREPASGLPSGSCGTPRPEDSPAGFGPGPPSPLARPASACGSLAASDSPRNLRATPTPVPKTYLYICPGFKFQIVDALLTNFHRPRSTVLVMTSAFADRELILAAYKEAIRKRYRLFSYGDCMLIL